jgi:hypothetical protein
MAVLGQSYAEPVALRAQYGCFKIGSPLTLIVAPQFLTVPNDTQDPVTLSYMETDATGHDAAASYKVAESKGR